MPRALIVDDLEQNRYMLEALLRGKGYQVTSAANGCEALDAARREVPDLAISDILMPTMDGFALCRAWKQDPQLRSVPFVFYTATYTDPQAEHLALSLGADRFIIKPIEPQAFVQAIEEVLAKGRQHELGCRAPDVPNESSYLKRYNDVLVQKLDRKVRQLEEANRALSTEISDRKRIEQALRESEEHFRRVVQETPMPIAIVGEHDEFVHLNEQFTNVFGYTAVDLPCLAAWWSLAFPDEQYRQDVVQTWRREVDAATLEGRDIEPREVVILGKNGAVHIVEMHIAPMGRDLLVLFNDITERRRLELLRDEFLAAAAHELKTPVTTIKGYAQLLQRWAPGDGRPSKEQVAITTIDAQCDRIQRRVDEMLAAARYRTGLPQACAERIDFGELAHDVIRRLQATTDTRILFEQPGPLLVEGDRERLDEALVILLDRTLRAAPDGADVRVQLYAEGGKARLSITGGGLVVPKDRQSAYFEPLYESQPAAAARHLPIVELGPYLARLAVEGNKGRVWLEMSERGESVFVVTLPSVEK
jgi:PAS domain S-box-containing protein